MFERFVTESRHVVVLAQQEARALRSPVIGPEHLLLGLLAQPDIPVAQTLYGRGMRVDDVRRQIDRASTLAEGGNELDQEALATLGIDLEAVRRATEANFGPGALDSKRKPTPRGHIPFTPVAKKSLELALREAVHLEHNHIGPEHLLLGLMRADEGTDKGVIGRVLAKYSIEPNELRKEIVRSIVDRAA
jgi:ATP-dependent Clp protease ATP-binding subunit ClpA